MTLYGKSSKLIEVISMSHELQPQHTKEIQKTDVLSSAAITALITFIVLTWSKTISYDAAIFPYVTEQTISFVAGLASYLVTIALAFLRYEVRLLLYRRDYTKKIKYLDQIIDTTTCQHTKADLERQKNSLLIAAAKAISEEKV